MLRALLHARPALAASLLAALPPAIAQDPVRGAMLYMRAPGGGPSCVSCHGPDPGASPNNILRAADQPDALTKALNTVSRMGFLRPLLTDADRADVAAFLGTVAAQGGQDTVQLWPVTIEFGAVQLGAAAATVQRLRLRNRRDAGVAVDRIAAEGAGLVAQHDCPSLLAAGADCDITLRFRPAATGWSGGAVRVDLAGSGRPLLAGASVEGRFEPASALQWPEAAEGTVAFDGAAGPVRRALTLHNPGPMPATLAEATIVGPRAPQFRIEELCSGTSVLQAGASCRVVVAFTPGPVAAEAILQVRADQGHPSALYLEGAAAAPAPDPVLPAVPPEPPASGGGCSVGPPRDRPVDPTLALLAALAALGWHRRRPRC